MIVIAPLLAFLAAGAGSSLPASASVPARFVGRYEESRKNCQVPMSDRQVDEADPSDQGGGLLEIHRTWLYFAEDKWPVRNVRAVGANSVSLDLIDVDPDTKKVSVLKTKLTLQGRMLTQTDVTGSQRYYRCKNGF